MKTCTACRTPKIKDDFYSGQGRCKECFKERVREPNRVRNRHDPKQATRKRHYLDRARTYVQTFLSEQTCVDCGEGDNVVLEFDHVRGTKVASVATLVSNGASNEKLAHEISKCEVVCANCHRRRTAKRAGWWKASI